MRDSVTSTKVATVICFLIVIASVVWIIARSNREEDGVSRELSRSEIERLWLELREQVYTNHNEVDLEEYKRYVLSYPDVARVYRWNGPNGGYENTLAQLFHMAIWDNLSREQKAALVEWERQNKSKLGVSAKD